MDCVKIFPSALSGEVTVPPSKSAAHRNIICAALGSGVSKITPACHSNDIDATLFCVKALGASVSEKDGAFYITGIDRTKALNKKVTLDCKESGSTLRFILPIAAALGANATFIGSGRLPLRPITPLTSILRSFGVECSSDTLPLTIKGKLNKGEYAVSGDISSQYLTGLIFAASITGGSARLTTPLQSAGYVDLTLNILKNFGVDVKTDKNTYLPTGNFISKEEVIEGDWSQACFFIAAGALGGNITVKGLDLNSAQGDKSALEYFKALGADISTENNCISVKKGVGGNAKINCSQIPDMVPSLAVAAALLKGETQLFGAARLRLKESDRIKTVVSGLKNMGIEVTELEDGMIIKGGIPKGGFVDGSNDHRIVMAFSVLAAFSRGETVISDVNAINKSYPDFFEDFRSVGGKFICHQL